MRFARSDLRTHIDSYKNDHRPSYWLQSTLRQQQCLKNDFREIFGVFRFSTFSTASVKSGSVGASRSCLLYPTRPTAAVLKPDKTYRYRGRPEFREIPKNAHNH